MGENPGRDERMEMAIVLKIVLTAAGIVFLALAFRAYARQNLTDSMGLGWGIFSILLVIVGSIIRKTDFSGTVSLRLCMLVTLLFLFLIGILFGISVSVSRLRMKNQELAMQVSLLNQENERILHKLKKITGESTK